MYFNEFDLGIVCLLISVSYAIQKFHIFNKVDNRYIPLILAILGAIMYSINHSIHLFGVGFLLGLVAVGSTNLVDTLISLLQEKVNGIK